MNERQLPKIECPPVAARKSRTLCGVRSVAVWCAAAAFAHEVPWCSAQQAHRPTAVRIVPAAPFSLDASSSVRRKPTDSAAPVSGRKPAAVVPAPVVAAPTRSPASTHSAPSAFVQQRVAAAPVVAPQVAPSPLSRRAAELGRQMREQFLAGPRSTSTTPLRDVTADSGALLDEVPSEQHLEVATPPQQVPELPLAAAVEPAATSAESVSEESAPEPEADAKTTPPAELSVAAPAAGEPVLEEELQTPSLAQLIVPAPVMPRRPGRIEPNQTPPANAVLPATPATPVRVSATEQIRQALQIILQQKFPEHRIKLESEGTALVVTGTARSRQEAVQIVAFLRDSYLAPVIDRLQVPRAGAVAASGK